MPRFHPGALLLALAAALLGAAAPLAAQEIRVQGDDRSRAVQVIREILARGTYLRIDRDTVLPADFRAAGDLLVLDADVRLEGTVEGAVAVVRGDFFIRPGARVGGPIAVVDGGVYTSRLAATGEILTAEPGTEVRLGGEATPPLAGTDTAAGDTTGALAVEVRPDTGALEVEIVGAPEPRRFSLFALAPSYDRVAAVTVTGGVRARLSPGERGGRAAAWVSYRSAFDERPLGGGARVDLPLGFQDVRLTAEASRAVRTNDGWIRGDVSNSFPVAISGNDYRDYYDADRFTLMVARPVARPLVAGESWLGPRVGLQISRDRSLRAKDVWSLFEDEDEPERFNPPVLEGTLVSALVGAELRWRGTTSSFDGDVTLEQAIPGESDAEFTQVVGDALFSATAFRTHLLSVRFRGMAPLAGDAPPQRFGILGGGGTIPTLDIAHFRGDHLVFVESGYAVPIPTLVLPYLGSPSLELSHAVGAAWRDGDDVPPWVQNVGAGLAFTFVRLRVLIDPENPEEPKFSFNFSVPRF